MISLELLQSSRCRRIMRVVLLAVAMAPTIAATQPGEFSPHDLALLDRLTWGVDASSAEHLRSVGMERWLQEQLHPPASMALPAAVNAQIEAMPDVHKLPFDMAASFDQQAKSANQVADPEQKKAAQQVYQGAMNDRAKQAAARTILRALYAPDQLRERMTWFWFNHFNVHQYKANLRILVGDYVDHAIRPFALGKFRDLLSATLHHPAMLRYLDNADNAAGHINENYAREIMELHTMGVGSGYSQKDVQELARILTGVGVSLSPGPPNLKPAYRPLYVRAGLFEFNPNRHDFGDKVFLGHRIRGSGFGEVEQALDILAREPATARHVSLELATYFVGDDPPPALVDRMAGVFRRSDGDIAEVLSALFASREFEASLGHAFKDPQHYVVSAVRLAYDQNVIRNTGPMQAWLNRLGEGLYGHETPDGYPMTSAAWNGPGQMATRFEIARQLGSGPAGLFRVEGAPADAPAFPRLENALFDESLARTLQPATQAALGQATSPEDWNTLYLASPDFMRR